MTLTAVAPRDICCTALEQWADQAADKNYYGLQDVCLLIAEAVQQLPESQWQQHAPALESVFHTLSALIGDYYQYSPPAIEKIINILRHPALNSGLAEEDYAMLAASLVVSPDELPVQTEGSNQAEQITPAEAVVRVTAPPPALSREALELVELLALEADIIQRFLLAISPLDVASVRHGLAQTSDELERYVNVSHIAGFQGLVQICEQVNTNIQQFNANIDAFTVTQHDLLCAWISHVKDYLTTFNEADAGQMLLAQLADPDWALPLTLEVGTEILTAIRLNASSVCAESSEPPRKQIAESEDISLALPTDVNHELLEILLQELPVQTQQFSAALQQLQAGGALSHLDVAQRVAHTIKGSANTVGIKGIAVLTHHLEDILEAYAREQQLPNNAHFSALIDAADCLEGMSEALMGLGEPPPEALAVLQAILKCANQIEQSGIVASTTHASIELAVETDTPESPVQAESDNATAAPQAALVRVSNEQIEYLFRHSGESIIVNGQANERLRRLKNQLQTMEAQFTLLRTFADELEQLIALKDLSSHSTETVDAEFDALEMDQYNELHTVSRRLIEAAIDAREMNLDAKKEVALMGEALDDQQQLVLDSQNAIMQMRLVPVSSLVPRLQRALRQTCRLTRKPSDLIVRGDQLLIDGEILNSIIDPLMHLLRNAVDHGIESAEERLAQGKSAQGNIGIEFDREGTNILVRCRDDGRGLDLGAIRAAAESRGVIQAGQVISEKELTRLILRPNFSTRSHITQTSGRGVGMDVVHYQVSNLGGSLALHSVQGAGLTVELRMPLPLSRSHALLANAGTYRLALASKGLLQILSSSLGTFITVGEAPMLQIGNDSYPVVALNTLLNIPEQRPQTRSQGAVLLVQNDNAITAVVVDAITDSLDIVIKNFGTYIKKIPGFIGAAIMGDSSVVPVVDIPELLRTATFSHENDSEVVEIHDSHSQLPRVLVVDDSLSQRRALEHMLQDTGFLVRTAHDGIEAAEMLAGFTPDIILTDLEMPRMNGIELTAHIRARTGLKTVPIIMITSRTTHKHRAMAEAAGVNFYLVKPVREDDLLEKIHHLMETTTL